MFILHNRELPEGETAEPEDVVRSLITRAGGEPVHTLIWTNRKLAYAIQGNQTGTYVLAYFSGEGDLNGRISRETALSDRCLRHLALSIDELPQEDALPGPLTEPSVRPARRPEAASDEEGAPKVEGAAQPEPEKEKKLHESLDYKNVYALRRMVTSQGKLFSRVRSNLHAKHQRKLRQAVMRARMLALLPFVSR
jgi:ribosomal protein S18/ribosomal protein S6